MRRHSSSLEKFTCHNKIEPYFCKDCDFETGLTILFRQHVSKHHDPKRQSRADSSSWDFVIKNYDCEKCDFTTNLSLKKLQHTLTCTGMKENRSSVSVPEKNATYYSTFDQTNGKRWFVCTECSYKARKESILKSHIGKHDSNQRYVCDQCPFKTNWKISLSNHIKRNHLDAQDVE